MWSNSGLKKQFFVTSTPEPSDHALEQTGTIIGNIASMLRKPAADMAHYIVIAAGVESGRKIEIGLAPIRVGRSEDNALRLADPFVSSHHCILSFEQGQLWVTDTGSTNGSFIEGERVQGRMAWPMVASLQIGEQILRHEYRRRAAVQDAENLARELRQAASYVLSLLPPPVASGAVRTSWQFQPSAELGGDIFDYFWLDADRFVFYLLDVCGHGVGAALHSVSVFNLLRQKSLPGVDFARPDQVLAALNNAFPMDRYGSMYFTMWYGVYHPGQQRLLFASAGHPPGLLWSEQVAPPLELSSDNPPVGVVQDQRFQERTAQLRPGCHLYLFSDGVYEFADRDGVFGDWSGFAQYLGCAVVPGFMQPATVFQELLAQTPANRFADDFSLVLLDF